MAYIYFKCSCGKSLAIDERGVGRIIECVDCGKRVTVPEWEYAFTCSECDATFGAASGIADDCARCVICGDKFIVPRNNAPSQNDLEGASIGEQTDRPVNEVKLPASGAAPNSPLPPAASSRKLVFPAIDWARLQVMLYRLTSVVVVVFIGVTGLSWFVSKVFQSNEGLSREIERSSKQGDVAASVAVLESAIKQYPLAFAGGRRARKLLADNKTIVQDTTNLSAALVLARKDTNGESAAERLAKAIKKYRRAANRAEAETLEKNIQAQLNDSWVLSLALRNGRATADVPARIELLKKALTECPCATNRADAEAMIAAAGQQLRETAGLDQAIQHARKEGDPSENAKLLADALAKYPQATNREAALGLLKNLQTQAGGQVKDPLLQAIVSARAQDTFAAAIRVLTEALKINKDSPYRVEAEQVLAVYQKQSLERTTEQKSAVTDYIEEATDALASSGYVFLPPNKALAGAGGVLSLYDSPLANKIIAMNYGVEVRLRKIAGKKNKDGAGGPPPADSLHYVPRLILSAKNGEIPRGNIVVIEYYLADYQDKAAGQRAKVERITFPKISKGQALAVDCRGIECSPPVKGAASKKEAGNKLYGIIVSVYGKGSELLLQKCSMAKLVKECSVQTY
ncbi:MAG: hypothetical protein WC381_04480 [Kiritimatiellia bacterium]|jgi:DNA-directed RNA polymerase subunit RPC12/RpoP